MGFRQNEPGDSACIHQLERLGIAPLTAWDAQDCASLDDLAVVVAQALHLEVEGPDDPRSYLEALRKHGLPVDSLLPERPVKDDPPLLLPAEVRRFFAQGLAAPLPGSEPLQPY